MIRLRQQRLHGFHQAEADDAAGGVAVGGGKAVALETALHRPDDVDLAID